MEAQVVRCVTLLVAMARARRGVQLRPFAERHGWSWRSAYRDVETLRAAGVPVEHPEQGWFRVPASWLPVGTVDASEDERAALIAARQLAPGLRDTVVGRALESLWGKLAAPGRQGQLPLSEAHWLSPRPAAIDYGPHRVVIDAVRAAVRARRALRIGYRKPDGSESERVIEPALVRWDPGLEALYVAGWCRLRGAPRVFAVHRIARAELTDEAFAPRREAAGELERAFRLWTRPTVERVVLRFSAAVAGEVRERRWHASERWRDAPDGGVVLELEIAAPAELERWLLGFGADVTIEAPEALAERVRARHAEAARLPRLGLLRGARPAEAARGVPSVDNDRA
jgi:predicted DNA-binding transcriptional regulator YafY